MKRTGILFLIFLMIYSNSFAMCYVSLVEILDDESKVFSKPGDKNELVLDIANDVIAQPFLLDCEFNNINAIFSCIDKSSSDNPVFYSACLYTTASFFGNSFSAVSSDTILSSQRYFIPSFRLVNLLGHHFSFRI
jgi:hypothetical protein